MEQSNYRVIILLLIISATIALAVALSGKKWVSIVDQYSGLWELCREGKECEDIEHFWIPAVRGFLMAGISFLGMSCLYYAAMVTRPKSFGSMCWSVFLGIATALIIIGLSVYTYYDMDSFTNSFRYHWCFFVGWLGALIAVIATGMTCYDARRLTSPYDQAIRLE